MTLKTIISVVMLAATLASAPVSAIELQHGDALQLASSNSLPSAIRGKGCTFYERANGKGESWHKAVGWKAQSFDNQDSYSEYVTTVGDWWDDRISSIRCDEGAGFSCMVAVYRDTHKRGGDAIFWSSQGLFNLDDWGWNNTISSYQIFCNLMK